MPKKDIGHLFKIISDGIRSQIDSQLRDQDLTCSQLRLLGYLDRNSGKATQKQLEDFLEVSHPTVVGIINRLEKNGYVESYFDENNKRSKIIVSGEKAIALSKQARKQRKQTDEILLNGLSEEEVKELVRLLNIVYNNIKNK